MPRDIWAVPSREVGADMRHHLGSKLAQRTTSQTSGLTARLRFSGGNGKIRFTRRIVL